MLKQRILTALVLLPISIICILWLPNSWFGAIVAITLALGCWEWTSIVPLKRPAARMLYVFITAFLALFLLYYLFFLTYYFIFLSIVFWLWACAAVFCYAKNWGSCGLDSRAAKMIFGIVIFLSCFFSIVFLKIQDNVSGLPWLLMGLFVVISTDVGAFFSGKLWGKSLLAERVSPKKTWAGFWGGVIFAMIISLVFSGSILLAGRIPLIQFVRINIASLAAILISIMGDLYESVLKRQAGIKDSGNLLPGHGGMLDRIDSILAAMPVFLLIGFM